jgi:phage head maturation protease
LAEVEADPEITYVGDLVKLIERGDAKGGSFAFTAIDDAWSLVDGEPFRQVLDMHVREVSLGVSFSAYALTARDPGDTSQARIVEVGGMSIAMAGKYVRQWRTR